MAGHDRLTPEGKRLFDELKKLQGMEVRVGFHSGSDTAEDGVDICDIAAFNELGTVDIPARPFLRDSVDDNAGRIDAFCKTQVRQLAQGVSAEQVLKQTGVMQKGLVQQKIVNGEFAANAPSTVRKKKSDRPLIDNGRMRQAVNFVITEKGHE